MKPGVYYGLPAEEYHAAPGISATILKAMRRSPAHMRAKMDQREETDAMRLGTLVHLRLLEPEAYKKQVVVEPLDAPKKPTKTQLEAKQPSPATLAAISWWKGFEEQTSGKTVIDHWLAATVENIAAAVLAHPIARELLTGEGHSEVSIFAIDPVTGLPIKCRVDRIKGRVFADVKVTNDASDWAFAKTCADMGYHLQDPHYVRTGILAGVEVEFFVFIAVEPKPPYAVNCVTLGHKSRTRGDEECGELMKLYAECLAERKWPAYPIELHAIDIPRYALMRPEDGEVIYTPGDES